MRAMKMCKTVTVLAVCSLYCVYANPMVKRESETRPRIQSLRVNSNIYHRFARTEMISKILNPATTAQEVTFRIVLPDSAFISNFTIAVDGEEYPASIKEKAAAKEEYNTAVTSGQTAGLVETKARDSNKFQVTVNVLPEQKVTFRVLYEELLSRRLGQYEHIININPGQFVEDLYVEVNIEESRNITLLKVPQLRNDVEIHTNEEDNSVAKISQTGSTAQVVFNPSIKDQKELSEQGINGQFVVEYDVERTTSGGEIEVVDGYFVHFFAPPVEKPLDKHITFVLDRSGSMSGRKMEQLKEAMLTILNQLNPGDLFSLVTFSSDIEEFYKLNLLKCKTVGMEKCGDKTILGLPVTQHNINEATKVIQSLDASGGTNINDAVISALDILKSSKNVPIIVFLTDGEATEGVTNADDIVENIRTANKGNKVPIYSLSFGTNADFNLLQKISLVSRALARKIYEAADAALQLESFYSEVANPLLNNIKIKYVNRGEVVNVTEQTELPFHTYCRGHELVVAGRIQQERLVGLVEADSAVGHVNYTTTMITRNTTRTVNFIERLWGYLTIKELLSKELKSDSEEEKQSLRKRALELSLKYHFVTPVTSLVVVKPNTDEDGNKNSTAEILDAQEANEAELDNRFSYGAPGPSSGLARPTYFAAPPRQRPAPPRQRPAPPKRRPAPAVSFRPPRPTVPYYTTTTRQPTTTVRRPTTFQTHQQTTTYPTYGQPPPYYKPSVDEPVFCPKDSSRSDSIFNKIKDWKILQDNPLSVTINETMFELLTDTTICTENLQSNTTSCSDGGKCVLLHQCNNSDLMEKMYQNEELYIEHFCAIEAPDKEKFYAAVCCI